MADTVAYDYDDAGRLVGIVYDESSIAYTYDDLGNLLYISVEGDGIVLVVDKLVVDVSEGDTAQLSVKLSQAPGGTTNVNVASIGGDSDLSIASGGSLTFGPSDWDEFQAVTFAAAEDADADNGTATFAVQSAGLPDLTIIVREVDDEAPSCSFALDRTSRDFVVQGGTDDVRVTTDPACGWTATSNAAWISIDSGVSYTGTDTVTYTVAESSASDPRTGTMTIAGETFTVHQAGTVTAYTLTVVKIGTGSGTVTSNPTGISCGAICEYSFSEGTDLSLTEDYAAGSHFTGWSGPCTGDGSCSVNMQDHTTVTAVFDLDTDFEIISTRPADGDTGVAVDRTFGIDFSDTVQQGPDFAQIELSDAGGAPFPLEVYVYPDNALALVNPMGHLEYATTYTLTIPAGAFENGQGDPLSSVQTVSFTTLDLGSPRLSVVGHPRWLYEGTQATASAWFDRRSEVSRIVTLSKSGTGDLTFPSQVIVPAGALKVDFTVTATQNSVSDGDRSTTLTAQGGPGQQDSFVFDVLDDDTYNSGAIRQIDSWLQNDDDGDGIFEADEWSEMVVEVKNFGSSFVSPVAITAEVVDTFELDPRGSAPHCNVYNLHPGVSNTCDFDLIADDDIPSGRYHVKIRGEFSSLWFEEYTAVDVVNEALPDFEVDATLQGITVDPEQLFNLEYVTLQSADGFDPALPLMAVYFEPVGGVPDVVYETYSVTRGYLETEEVIEFQVGAPSIPGDYRVWAEINPDLGSRIIEADYSNNLSPDITITVRDPNRPPEIDPIPDATVVAGTSFTTVATASDPDPGDTLTFDLESAPAGAVIDPSTGVFSWTPDADLIPDVYGVTVLVTDSGSLPDSTPFNLTVVQEADLSVLASNGLSQAVPGQWLSYEVAVSNLGPSAIGGASVSQMPSTDLVDVTWTCSASAGSQCAANGTGFINDSPSLLPQGSVVYTVSARVADTASVALTSTFSVAPPAGATDPQSSNDQATDVDTLVSLDFGDAPDDASSSGVWRYATRLTDDGARHGLTGALYLGGAADGEADGQPTLDASGDDVAGADEDGVTFVSPLAVCETAELEVTASAAGFLDGWLDLNADGDWNDSAERIFDREPLVLGMNGLTFTIPCTSLPVSETFARFRMSSAGGLAATGLALDGEIEDYRVGVYGVDFGDAPEPGFPTLRASDGARHVLANGLFLGSLVDGEADGQPDVLAAGDDGAGSADEDGVVVTSLLVPGAPASFQVTASAAGLLDAWIDLNGNGDWDDSGEQVVGAQVVSAGANDLSFPLPAEASPGIDAVARFRLSTDGVLTAGGLAFDGEVEDHRLSIAGVSDLSVTKSDSRTSVAPGESVTYAIVVYNDGPSSASGVRVLDPLPAPFSGATWSCVADLGATCTPSGSGGIDDDQVFLPVGGQVVYSLAADLPASATDPVLNTVTVSPPAAVTDPDLSNNTASDENLLAPRADLAVNLASADSDVLPGQVVTFAITVANFGPSDVTGVAVEDPVPNGLTDVSWSCSASAGASCGSGSGDLVDTVTLPSGGDLAYSYSGALMDGVVSLSNRVDVLLPAGVTDFDPGNNSATVAISLRGIDYGDAPDATSGSWSYPTRLAADGARHGIVAGLALGAVIDSEPDGQPESDASGDDATGDPSDEDGVVFLTPIELGTDSTVRVQTTSSGVLDVFFDWNRDSDWLDENEHVFLSLPVSSGQNDLALSVPADATPGSSFARFRLSSAGGLSPTGLAVDGEIEDYAVLVESSLPPLTAAFTVDVVSGTVPLTVQFTDQSAGNPTSWLWQFGDGKTSTLRNPMHEFRQTGTYTVRLMAAREMELDDVVGVALIRVLASEVVDFPEIVDLNMVPGEELGGSTRIVSGESTFSFAAGDFNCDDYDDVVIGAPSAGFDGEPQVGRVYVIYGFVDLAAVVEIDLDDVLVPRVTNVYGDGAGDNAGYSVSAGDLNRDGCDDLILGALQADPAGGANAGVTYILYGGSGIDLLSEVDLGDSPIGVTRISGDDAEDWSGWDVSSGDMNGDGYSDVIVGAYRAGPAGRAFAGETYIVYGSSDISDFSNIDLNGSPAHVTRILGDDVGDWSGHSVSAGDVNGDGYADVVIGAPLANTAGGENAGETYVVYGASGLVDRSSIDLNDDVGGVTRIFGNNSFNNSGETVSVGDINGDGYSDVVIGARLADAARGEHRVQMFVVYGGGELDAIAEIDLEAESDNVTRIYKEEAEVWGISVVDLNGDSYGDLVIGDTHSGETYLLYGSSDAESIVDVDLDEPVAGITRILGSPVRIGVSSGDANGDGYGDIVINGPRGGFESRPAYVLYGGHLGNASLYPTLTVFAAGDGVGTVTSSPGGIDCGGDCLEQYSTNEEVTLTATPDSGSAFGGWSGGGCEGAVPCTVLMDAHKSVTANFHFSEYPLAITKTGSGTVTSDDTGIGCGGDCDEIYAYDTAVRLMAVPSPGWVFDYWSGDCVDTGFCDLTMDSAKSVEAIFARPSGLAVIYSPSPFGYVPLASLGVTPFNCPTVPCDDTGWVLDGLDFYWWGQHYDSVSWVTNGYIYLDSSGTATPANQDLPDPVVPNAVLAPFWSNLDLDGGDGVGGGTWYLANLTDGDSTWHVFEWESAQALGLDGSSYSFQIWIEIGTSNIWFTYGSMSAEPPAAVTVGAEDDAGGEGFLFYHDGVVLPPEGGTELRVVAPGYCAGVTDLEVADQVLSALEVFEACNSITVGPALDVVFPGDVRLSSGGVVEIKDGLAVHSGAQLEVSSGPVTGPMSALSVSPDVAVPQIVGTVGIE